MMQSALRQFQLGMLFLCVSAASRAAVPDDVVFRAMQDELGRSMNQLVIENMSRPYYLSYRVEDDERVTIDARDGALVQSQRRNDRFLYVDLRVGDSTLDNTNFVGTWGDVYHMREDVACENDYQALRHQIWLFTDKAYKSALENLGRKKAFLQTHPSQDSIADFAKAEQRDYVGEPIRLSVNVLEWENTLRAAAEALRDYPELQDWKISYSALSATKRYVNSEGSHHKKGAVNQEIEVSATAQAADGQRLSAFREFITRDEENPPQGDALVKAVRKMAEELQAAAKAMTIEEYSGPVLFSDYASAQLVSELFASQLALARAVQTPEDWMLQYFPQGKLAERVNRRVLPDFVTITDDPNLSEWKGHRLLGHHVVDDEGVPCRTITLVDKGRLMTLPTTRQPTKKVRDSNGHARTLPNQWDVPVVTNLFVKSDQALAAPQLLEKLRRLAKDSGSEYGLLVTLLEDQRVSDDYSWMESTQDKPKLLDSPVIMYKVYVKDGKIEPVRGLAFDEVSIRSLRDVSALGKDEQLYGILQPTTFQQVRYPISIVTPSILVEEMELKANSGHEPLPLSSNPLFEK